VIFRGVFSLYYSPEVRTKLRWASRGGRGGGEGGIVFFRAPKGAMDGARVAWQRSSEGCSVAQRVQRSS
jgi:hypothetical protein